VAKAWCGEVRSSGRPFYRRPRRGRGARWCALATLAAAAIMAHSCDGMAREEGVTG
jgi:hypothetical protein